MHGVLFKPPPKAVPAVNRHNSIGRIATLAMLLCLTLPLCMLPVKSALGNAADQQDNANINAVLEKGIYWFERYRFDLAVQLFNKALLMNPNSAKALRWQGLVDVAKGEAMAASVWLNKLQNTYGNRHPDTIELRQAIELISTKRQLFSEIKYMATSDRKIANWPRQLKSLFPEEPLGDAAVQYYLLLNEDRESKAFVRQKAAQLVTTYPGDRRYRKLLNDLGANLDTLALNKTSTPGAAPQLARKPVIARQPTLETAFPTPTRTQDVVIDTPSDFAQAQQLSDDAQALLKAGQTDLAIAKLEAAVALQPDYPWFRYDLALVLAEQPDPQSKQTATHILETGLQNNPSAEMRFAAALLASKQNRGADALALLEQTPKDAWSAGMSALERQISYGTHLESLRKQRESGDFNGLAQEIVQAPRWRAEPEVMALEQEIRNRTSPRFQMAYTPSKIDGTAGFSEIELQEIPTQLDLPLNANDTLFLRLDTLKAHAGQLASADTPAFAQLGTTLATNPDIQPDKLTQNFQGQLVGVGIERENVRADLGSTVGNFPVNDWVGGMQWQTALGDGVVRVELGRRMVQGSVLATTGATDPLTGQSWGGARRNGLSTVVYQPLTDKLDFVGIGRVNRITGKHMPGNTELNLQGILSQTLYQGAGQRLEVGASLFLWKFNKNLRFYTYGQGGYYSPQSFASLYFPVTWTGNTDKWSWRARLGFGRSKSRENPTDLYPLDPELAQAASLLGNPTTDPGGSGGGTGASLGVQVERLLAPNLAFGLAAEIDRSEGYNPDRFQLYWKYSFSESLELGTPPQGLTPYSRF